MVSGILEDENEKPEVEAPEALAGVEAFASALAAKLAGNDPEVARDTSTFLKKQAQLLDIQAEHLKDEHADRLHLLRGQVREVDIRRFGLRLRVGLQLFFVLVATVIGIGVVVLTWHAVHSRNVVIDRFETAPALAPSGLNGNVVASGLLDVLTKIQAATRSNAKHRSLSNAWTNDIAIEVPNTGISIGQLEEILKTRFGNDQHISGDLALLEKDRLALTVRGNGILPRTFTMDPKNLEKLLRQAGEYVYGQSQPGLWTAYLSNNDRPDDAIKFAEGAYVAAEASERPYILNYWALAIVTKGDEDAMRNALPLYREAVRQKTDFWIGYLNVMNALNGLGREEEAIREGEQLIIAAGGRPGRAPEDNYQNYDSALWDLPRVLAVQIADMESNSGIGTTTRASGAENFGVAETEAQMHDVEAASVRLKTTRIDPNILPDVAAAAFDQALIAQESMDFQAAAREWDAYAKVYANPTVSTNSRSSICFSAPAYERTGQPVKADEALTAVGSLTLVDCYRFKADVFDLRGNWPAAQEWYAKAVNLAPSIPSGYYSWGLALANHGDLAGAEAKLKEANQKGPHWADPLKAWGDVLAKQGRAKEALRKYDEALKYAPNWSDLKEARQAAAKQKS